MSSSQLAIVQTYKVQTNGSSTASKAKKPSHGSHSISVYCNNTSVNYCNIFAYLRITYNTSGACLNLPEYIDILTQIMMDSQRNNVDYGVDKQEELLDASTLQVQQQSTYRPRSCAARGKPFDFHMVRVGLGLV